MKFFHYLFLLFLTVTGQDDNNAYSSIPGDNSLYKKTSRFIWMHDHNEQPILVDLEEGDNHEYLTAPSFTINHNKYFLYTKKNPKNPELLFHYDKQSLLKSNFSSNKPLFVLVHGWRSDGTFGCRFTRTVTTAILSKYDVNVIALDWSNFSHRLYPIACIGVYIVGKYLGHFLTWLVEATHFDWNMVHGIGHSLGCHVIGKAGRTVNGKIGRITGLDPAGPLWWFSNDVLGANDAQYVEIIHTDGSMLGLLKPTGHVDFYPNRGQSPQPGCFGSICSHLRAYELMASTIQYNHLSGNKCKNFNEMEYNKCTGKSYKMGNADVYKYRDLRMQNCSSYEDGVNISQNVNSKLYGLSTGATWPF